MGFAYKIRVMKTGHIITTTKGHGMVTFISLENYVRNEMMKVNKCQTDNRLDELIDRFAKTHNSEHLNNIEME